MRFVKTYFPRLKWSIYPVQSWCTSFKTWKLYLLPIVFGQFGVLIFLHLVHLGSSDEKHGLILQFLLE